MPWFSYVILRWPDHQVMGYVVVSSHEVALDAAYRRFGDDSLLAIPWDEATPEQQQQATAANLAHEEAETTRQSEARRREWEQRHHDNEPV